MSIKSSPRTSFRKRVYICLSVLGSLIIFFSIALVFDGPRIRKVEFDAYKITRETNQTILMRSNQLIKALDSSQISINPDVDFSVTTTGEAIIINLKERLDYETNYSIKIKDMQSDNGRSSSYEAKIKTGNASYHYLKRNGVFSKEPTYTQKQPDQIIRGSLNGQDEVVYSAHQIVDFVMLEESLVISQVDEFNEINIIIYDEITKKSKEIMLPDKGTVQNLKVSPNEKLFGFTFSSDKQAGATNDYQQRLFVYDVVAKILVPMRGIGKEYIDAFDWKFAPDGTTIIASTWKTGVIFIDSYSKNEPIPIGSYYNIGNFSRTGSKVVLDTDEDGPIILDLIENKKIVPETQEIEGVLQYITGVKLLQNSNSTLKKTQTLSIGGGASKTAIVVSDGKSNRTIFNIKQKETDITDFGSSGNDQYVTVETSGSVSNKQHDGYPENSRPINIKTRILDMKDSKTLKTIDGFMLTWE